MHRGVVRRPPIPEDLYASMPAPEPVPDYQVDDDDDDLPPPPPPLTSEDLSAAVSAAYDANCNSDYTVSVEGSNPASSGSSISGSSADDLPPPTTPSHQIFPRPLHNPCLESRDRQALHKELLMNQRLGKDVLQKPELDKVLRDRKATQRKKEWSDHQHNTGRTSLEIKLEERANRMKEEEEKKMNIISEEEQTPELLRMHRKILKPGQNASSES